MQAFADLPRETQQRYRERLYSYLRRYDGAAFRRHAGDLCGVPRNHLAVALDYPLFVLRGPNRVRAAEADDAGCLAAFQQLVLAALAAGPRLESEVLRELLVPAWLVAPLRACPCFLRDPATGMLTAAPLATVPPPAPDGLAS